MLITADEDTQARLLANPLSSASAVFVVTLARIGKLMFPEDGSDPIDPLELEVVLEEQFRVTVPDENLEKINALWLAVESNAFYEDALAFAGMCTAISTGTLGDIVDGFLQPPDIDEVLWALREVALIRDGAEPVPFSKDVRGVILSVLRDEADDIIDGDDATGEFLAMREDRLREDMIMLGVPGPEFEKAYTSALGRSAFDHTAEGV